MMTMISGMQPLQGLLQHLTVKSVGGTGNATDGNGKAFQYSKVNYKYNN